MERLFLEYSAGKLEQLTERIVRCLDRLTEEQIWHRGSDAANAAGNLVLHLCGNVRQWIGMGVAGLPDVRNRDAEFAAREGLSKQELAGKLQGTVREAAGILRGLPPGELARRTVVQGYDVTVLEAIYHVVEHFSGHTGQIIFLSKALRGEDLGFYRHLQRASHEEKIP